MGGALGAGTTVQSALAHLAEAFATAGIPDPQSEARLVLRAATGLTLATIISTPDHPLGAASRVLEQMKQRRLAHEPVSRIQGEREFYGLAFGLNAATLDPRPETEHLVDAILEWVRERPKAAPMRLLDLGTGSGAIAITLAHLLPDLAGLAVDIAPDAVAMARRNATAHGVADRLEIRESDLFSAVTGPFEIIVSNPPYIPHADLADLMPEVRKHDPAVALDGGADGLDFYRRILSEAPAYLAAEGMIALEIGIGQAAEVAALMTGAGFPSPRVIHDYAGIARVLTATWSCPPTA